MPEIYTDKLGPQYIATRVNIDQPITIGWYKPTGGHFSCPTDSPDAGRLGLCSSLRGLDFFESLWIIHVNIGVHLYDTRAPEQSCLSAKFMIAVMKGESQGKGKGCRFFRSQMEESRKTGKLPSDGYTSAEQDTKSVLSNLEGISLYVKNILIQTASQMTPISACAQSLELPRVIVKCSSLDQCLLWYPIIDKHMMLIVLSVPRGGKQPRWVMIWFTDLFHHFGQIISHTHIYINICKRKTQQNVQKEDHLKYQ